MATQGQRWTLKGLLIALVILGLEACASEVVRRPTDLVPAGESPEAIEVLADKTIKVGPGYERVIRRGSVWKLVGRSPEGDVYRPVDHVFTVEGAQVHEAYLVLEKDTIVGFYLPVERAFSPAPTGSDTRLSIQRR
jgi:hypothetical protein